MATGKAADAALSRYLNMMSKNYKVCDWKLFMPQ